MKSLKTNLIFLVAVILIIGGSLLYRHWQDSSATQGNVLSAEELAGNLDLTNVGLGDPEAPVTMVEYFSYYCGYCKLFHDKTLPILKEKYIDTGQLRLVLRPFPPYELGEAIICADEQDKFVEYNDYLFAKSSEIKGVDDLITYATDLGLTEDKFRDCLSSGKYLAEAQKWYAQGDKDFTAANVDKGQRGTPAFFIDGDFILGAQPLDVFEEKIDAALAK